MPARGPTDKINRPLQPDQKKRQRLMRRKRQERKLNKPPRKIAVSDPDLTSKHMIRKRKTNPRANITLSGKKKRKIINQIRRLNNEKSSMEVEIMQVSKKKSKSKKKANKSKKIEDTDNAMETD